MARIVFLVFLLTGCFAAQADELQRTVSVTGQGTAQTTPDRATVILAIMARSQSVADAQQQAGEVAAKVLTLADEMDVPANRVDTMSASVYPDYRWNQQRNEQEVIGYVAQRQMRVELRDLEKVGEFIERAVEQGVNQVMPPQLSSSTQRDAYREALEDAVEDARSSAERLAAALGATLGSAIQVSAGSSGGPPIPMGMMRQATAIALDESAATYNAGDQTVTANITVTFELTE